jgi:hypothetical protein
MIEATEVTRVFMSCLFADGEPTDPHVLVEGPLGHFGLHPARLESSRETVRGWLAQLAPVFSVGGGGSFLHLPFDVAGEQWGEHKHAQELIVLAQGLGLATCLLPREVWSSLPGGMPYYRIDLNGRRPS